MASAWALTTLILVAAVAWPVTFAMASHGGIDRLILAPAGPYVLSAWTEPGSLTTDGFWVSVAVMESGRRTPVLNARVRLLAEPTREQGARVMVETSRSGGPNRLLYQATLAPTSAERWRVTVQVTGAEGEGQAAFEVDVEPARSSAWLALAMGGMLIAIVVGIARARGRRRLLGANGKGRRQAGGDERITPQATNEENHTILEGGSNT